MSIEKRLERLEAILDARGLDWDHPRVSDEPAKEPPKKWRILEPGEVVCSGDRVNAKTNPPSDPPNGSGWRPVYASVGTSVCKDDRCVYARLAAGEPAKQAEPEHPAGPKPDPGEGYRILAKDPPEDLQAGDEYEAVAGQWVESLNAHAHRKQVPCTWYRRKIETPKPPEPEYRKPVLPADAGKECEFSDDGKTWVILNLDAWLPALKWVSKGKGCWEHCRIKKDA